MTPAHRLPREPGLLWPALWRLGLAGAVFVLVYGGCNHLTSLRENVPTIMFPWEKHIPFVREMVVPYWSLDLFFIAAFFLCRTRLELNLLTRRLVIVVVASGICFLLFPLTMGLERPEPEGWTAPLFKALYANDKPFNLAPSLHISLRSLLWLCVGAHLTGWTRRAAKVWFMLIGLSTLLVWQHHVFDVATGFLMGWAVAALVPDPRLKDHRCGRSPRLALRYGGGALACALLAFAWVGFVWPATALAIMALAYATGRPQLIGKENGNLSPAAEWCLLPVLTVTYLIQRKWLKRQPAWRELCPGVMWGRRLTAREAEQLAAGGEVAVIDLTAEGNAPPFFRERVRYHNVPLLDLVPPRPEHYEQIAHLIKTERQNNRRVYLHCQLGLQRSALAAIHWLVASGHAPDREAAKALVLKQEPKAMVV